MSVYVESKIGEQSLPSSLGFNSRCDGTEGGRQAWPLSVHVLLLVLNFSSFVYLMNNSLYGCEVHAYG